MWNSTTITDFRHMRLETPPIATFQERTIPAGTKLAGWAALVQALAVPAPVRRLSCVSELHVRGSHREDGETPSPTI
jgi:hypothetical protein